MSFNNLDDESDIAAAAAKVLRESFIKETRTNTVLYVENDAIWSKTPNSTPVLINNCLDVTLSWPKKLLDQELIKLKNEILVLKTNSSYSAELHKTNVIYNYMNLGNGETACSMKN